ncbi:MAG: CDGSH iron-sulfur domain-containing protein [Nitrososphaerota archaeon]|nr:CDGSH iron-sulfur domain-containing protein [Nitrososphaerota archaeon]MDG6938834.1 CDGSH iron-sulfur domain-containing protein [Nitrososphaerota archaeon]
MARLVRHDRNRPYVVKAKEGEALYMCACGLSKNKPYCDGSHKQTADEAGADLYVYEDGKRVRLVSFYQTE